MRNAKRVLFIERNVRNEKLGIMYLASSLKVAGHHADLVQTDKADLDAHIRAFRPDFVAFSITTGEHVFALKTAREVKARYGIPNVFGGPHCTFFPELGFEPDVDFVVQGHGERAIVRIVEGHEAPGFIKATMADHLDELAFPDRDIFYQYPEFRDNPMKNVITSRACPYKCSYCFNHSQMAMTRLDGETKQWFDRRSVENVVAEIDEIRQRYPLDKILYLDDSFIQSQSWLDAFLTGYTRDVRLPWMCSLRVNCLDEDLAQRMFRSGLEMVNYAMESADPDVQQRLLHRGHISNGDVIRAISLFDDFGVRARMQNMIGLPLTNPLEDALNTLQFNMRHRVTDSWCSIFQPYPRTALGQYCVDHGYATEDRLRHCSESFFDESRIDISEKDELYALQKLWYFVIDAELPLELVRILIRGRFTPLVGDDLQRLRFRCSRKKLYGIDDADPEVAIDLQSRERWAMGGCAAATGPASGSPTDAAAPLIRRTLSGVDVPDRFVDIMASVEFASTEVESLARYARGESVCGPTIYTIDDATGELADPNVSIYIRGTADPDGCDIRKMPESHFMRDMAETRDALAAKACGDPVSEPAESLVALDIVSHTGSTFESATATRVDSTDRDERHRNQYLA